MIIGSHVGMKAPLYLEGSVKEALSYGANALMVYTGAPQNTKRKPIDELHVPEALKLMEDNGISKDSLVVHAPYLINPANSDNETVKELAVQFLNSEIKRAVAFNSKYLVLHPGSYTTATLEIGLDTAIKQLNSIDTIPDGLIICLETMAGKGSEIGYQFEQLKYILDGLNQKDNYGICFDTCHTHDAGYDLTQFDEVLDEFDKVIGLDRLKVVHLNDSKNERGSRKDRHANIGEGKIGFETLYKIAHHELLKDKPIILETPYRDDKPPYKEEIAMLR